MDETPEPSGGKPEDGPIFVVQKHDARNLHYDFRLEIHGVLKSWAVPKGPSLDSSVKRLAIPTEDHPMDYARFEGTIPEGNYGAGPVIVWDTGKVENLKEGKNLQQSYDDGHITVRLHGKKLNGGFSLVRTSRDGNWLLMKIDDEHADARRNPLSTEPESVISGKTIEEMEEEMGG